MPKSSSSVPTASCTIPNGIRINVEPSTSLTVESPAPYVAAAVVTPYKTRVHKLGVAVHLPGHRATFIGIMNAGGNAVIGSLVQNDQAGPLTLTRQTVSEKAHAQPADVHGTGVITAIDTTNDTITLSPVPIAALG